jgi:hypothetical protein
MRQAGSRPRRPEPRAIQEKVHRIRCHDARPEPLDAAARHDLLETLEDRYGRRSTIVTSQLLVDQWQALIGDPTYADAVLDRLVRNAHRIDLNGESMRRTRKPPERPEPVALWTCRCAWTTRSALPTCRQQQQKQTFEPRFKIDPAAAPMPETSQNASRPGDIKSEWWAISSDHLEERLHVSMTKALRTRIEEVQAETGAIRH